ncbi:hypothetical protein OG250_07400 [Streptomyces sp. NBC_00487]|uniref:hypothetical protein n=1 Tax=unclassified Streptomyces TaxID=2593676 RepID=UPI002E18516C|nr:MULTISPECIES: hypothetical protein [unclassified Streptomyces]
MRAVEKVELTSASWANRSRSIQVEPLRKHIKEYVDIDDKRATLWLPVGNFPKGPLLDFDLEVAEGSAYLLRMADHSEIFAQYIADLARDAGIVIPADVKRFLEGVFRFTPASWQDLHQEKRLSPQRRQELVLRYLNRNPIMGWSDQPLTVDVIHGWDELIEPIRRLVGWRMVPTIDNVAANPLLALPGASELNSGALRLSGRGAVELLLEALRDFLVLACGKAERGNGDARKLLIHYADYGDHWDAIARCTIPLDEPFLIKTSERRGLHLGEPGEVASSHSKPRSWYPKNSSSQLVVWGDAQSNHVNIRVTDTNVELRVKRIRALNERHDVINMLPLYYEATPEFIGFYDSGRRRYFRIWVDLPLKTSTSATVGRLVILGLIASALMAFIIFVLHWFGVGSGKREMSGADVAVILVPSAIAASLLLVRESSTLSTELNKRSSIATASALVVLWVCTLIAYAVERIEWGSN